MNSWRKWFGDWVCETVNNSHCPLLTSAGAGSVESTYTDLRRATSGSSFRFTACSTVNTTMSHWVRRLANGRRNFPVNRDPDLGCHPQRRCPKNPFDSPASEVKGCWCCWGGSVTGCRGAAFGFCLAISRWTRFSRLKLLNIRPTREPMLHKLLLHSVDNKVAFNRTTATEKVQKAFNGRRDCQHRWTIKFYFNRSTACKAAQKGYWQKAIFFKAKLFRQFRRITSVRNHRPQGSYKTALCVSRVSDVFAFAYGSSKPRSHVVSNKTSRVRCTSIWPPGGVVILMKLVLSFQL